jgi:hypothetical protein
MPKQRIPTKKKFTWRKPIAAYMNPLQQLYEALNNVHWKNTRLEDLRQFKQRLNEKLVEVRKGKYKNKPKTKHKLSPCFFAFKEWSKVSGQPYTKNFYKEIWTPCWLAGVLPVADNEQQAVQEGQTNTSNAAGV